MPVPHYNLRGLPWENVASHASYKFLHSEMAKKDCEDLRRRPIRAKAARNNIKTWLVEFPINYFVLLLLLLLPLLLLALK